MTQGSDVTQGSDIADILKVFASKIPPDLTEADLRIIREKVAQTRKDAVAGQLVGQIQEAPK